MTKPDITPEYVERLIAREPLLMSLPPQETDVAKTLRAQAERIEELEDHISDLLVDLPCACGHDDPGDVCLKHMPKFRAAQERIKELEAVHKNASKLFAKAAGRAVRLARNNALREAADKIDRKVKAHQPEMTRWGQALASGKKPNVNYAIQRAALDARISDRDMVLALIEGDTND